MITDEAFKYGITGWQESTSTSPSGRHLGLFIVQHADFLHVQVQLVNIASKNGIALDRWCKSITVMIEKDIGRPAIHRLRIIHLLEADYNLFLKLQWGSHLARHGEKHHGLNDQHFGRKDRTAMDPAHFKQLSYDLSRQCLGRKDRTAMDPALLKQLSYDLSRQCLGRKDRTAMDPALLKQLSYDLSRQCRTNLATFDNDASACYNRIIVALATLAARRLRMPRNAIQTHAEALRLMRYYVKTVHGISEESYQGIVIEPLFGTGQGSGASPAA